MSVGFSAEKVFLEKFAQGRINYWVSFGSDSAMTAFFLAWDVHADPLAWPATLLLFASGFVLWGFSEYVFHRWAYHQKRGIFGAGHQMHHEEEKAYVAMPWFVSALAITAVWYVVAIALDVRGFSGFLAGWMAGFVLYSWVHHAHHHWSPGGAWMRGLRAHHRVHHKFPDCNFGVTMRLWDDVFGTRFRGHH